LETITRPHVLVVDDDPVLRMIAVRALETAGFAVEEADCGEAALEAIERCTPDLVLLDVDMPGLDGFETCAELRRRLPGIEIPVGLTDGDTIDRAFRSGATDFAKKPLDWQVLQHRLRFMLRASRAFSDLRDSRERLASAHRIAQMGNWEWAPGTGEMIWSEELHRMLGMEPSPEAATRGALLSLAHPDDRADVEKALLRAAQNGEAPALDFRIVSASGGVRVVHIHGEVERGPDGSVERIAGTLQDITDRKRAEEQIRQLAYYDSVTTLPNRRMLCMHLDRALEFAREEGKSVGLLHLSLDRFKRVNDTLGRVVGDELLRTVARRLLTSIRSADWGGHPWLSFSAPISRLGGDEFAIVLSTLRSQDDSSHAARRILDLISLPISVDEKDLAMSASIGIAIHPSDGDDSETLLSAASKAMHHAKADGGGVFRFFRPAMNEQARRDLSIEAGLRSAVARGELMLEYQPLLEARTDRIVGMEALVRWRSEEFGLLQPKEFVPLAEEVGLIGSLGEEILRKACEQAGCWRRQGLPPLRLAVNVSSQQIRCPELLGIVERALRDADLDPAHIELEITESALLADESTVLDNLRALKEWGVRVALDDFGTGFSSLSHLVRFPIDVLKIDQTFVHGIGRSRQADAIVSTVVAIAHRLGLEAVAEGVETEEQERYLREEGCDLLQGFRIARPLTREAFERVVGSARPGRPASR
jgi:diguanylate cyclase (GGDEF)-like protein/PAS domain S-box-containing protein